MAGAVACLILAACGDASGPASNPARLRVVQGDGQTAPGGEPLLQPVVFGVTDGADRPVEGVAITFAVVAGGGSVPAAAGVTGPDGSATTGWTLGQAEEPQVLEARAAGVAAVRATAVVGQCAPAVCPSTGGPILDAFELLTLGTYDHSGQVVHPDVAPLARIGGYPFWLGVTPYPNGNANFENPSMFQSANGRFWQVPAGLSNPVVRPASGYLSDPDVLFETGDGRLWLYYRQVTGGANEILLTRSADGLHWDAAEEVRSGAEPPDRVAHGGAGLAGGAVGDVLGEQRAGWVRCPGDDGGAPHIHGWGTLERARADGPGGSGPGPVAHRRPVDSGARRILGAVQHVSHRGHLHHRRAPAGPEPGRAALDRVAVAGAAPRGERSVPRRGVPIQLRRRRSV